MVKIFILTFFYVYKSNINIKHILYIIIILFEYTLNILQLYLIRCGYFLLMKKRY